MSSCISKASSGDTINVSAGSASWSGNITVNKRVSIIGAGIGNTVITGASFFLAESDHVRISGFSFNMNSSQLTIESSTNVRIDNNAFSNTSAGNATCILSYGLNTTPNTGVYDHNTFTYCQLEAEGGDFGNTGNILNYLWSRPNPVGTANAMYYEDNTFTNADPTSAGYFNCFDAYMGGSYVARFNTMDGCRLEAHGIQADNQRSVRSWEIYNNTMNNSHGTPGYRPWLLRGGTGMVFHNTLDNNWLHKELAFDGPRLEEGSITGQVPKWQMCDGTTQSAGFSSPKTLIVDAQGPGGYRCRDQIGSGPDATTWSSFSTTPPAQSLVPAYVWKNTFGGSLESPVVLNCESGNSFCTNQSTNLIKSDREYYVLDSSFDATTGIGEGPIANRPTTCKTGTAYWATDQGSWNQKLAANTSGQMYQCTSTNTWALYYTPYTYPHPLTQSGGGSGQPAPPTGLTATVQ